MNSILKLIRRFVGIMVLSFVLLILLNLSLLAAIAARQAANQSPWTIAMETAQALKPADSGFTVTSEAFASLRACGAWAVLIDESTGEVVWQTEDLPVTVPMHYTYSDIAALTRGYIDSYPTFPAASAYGLMVLGFPRTSYWKHMWPSWDYQLIAHAPQIALTAAALNLILILLIYLTANYRLLRSVQPLASGIQTLPSGEPVFIPEHGLLSELASSLNRTSGLLQSQKYELRKKETARANWIAGISHDIRTPLSMVMGYAEQLKDDAALSRGQQKKAAVILRESERMRDLVNDLNLASKLEYNMQPAHLRTENLTAIVRQAAVDFINADIAGKYPVEWTGNQPQIPCTADVDRELLTRAVMNLFHNCRNHNEEGCTIYISIRRSEASWDIRVEDDGVGLSDEELNRLRDASQGAACGAGIDGQRHGLGLQLVRQIASVFGGEILMDHSNYGGFSVTISLPAADT